MPHGVGHNADKNDTGTHNRDYAVDDTDFDINDFRKGGKVDNRFASARRQRRKKILLTVSLVVLVIIAAILLLLSPVFKIEKYEIQDMQFYTDEEIISVMKGIDGENGLIAVFENTSFDDADGLLRLRLPDVENRIIFNCPYIESVTVRFAFPNKIVVDAEERKPIFLTDFHNTYLYIDSKGVVLETFTGANRPDYPLVKGLEVTDYKIGCSIAETDNNKIFIAMKLCNTLSDMGILENNIDIIDVSDYNDIWMYCAPSLSIKFGGADGLEQKVSKLKGVFEAGYGGDTEGELDLYSGKNPVLRPVASDLPPAEDVKPEETPTGEE